MLGRHFDDLGVLSGLFPPSVVNPEHDCEKFNQQVRHLTFCLHTQTYSDMFEC